MATGVDRLIGQRIRELRTMRGVSQTALARALGLTQQQLGKYETGVDRITAVGVYLVSRLLDVPLVSFYDGVIQNGPAHARDADLPQKKEHLAFLHAYRRIRDPKRRSRIRAMMKLMADMR